MKTFQLRLNLQGGTVNSRTITIADDEDAAKLVRELLFDPMLRELDEALKIAKDHLLL